MVDWAEGLLPDRRYKMDGAERGVERIKKSGNEEEDDRKGWRKADRIPVALSAA